MKRWVPWALCLTVPTALPAADEDYRLTIRNHRFEPLTLEVPAGERVRLTIENQDPSPEEFESYALNREKIVAGNATVTLYIGPLEPGTYEYFGEFHPDTALGRIVAR